MLQLYDKEKTKLAGLVDYKDLCIEYDLNSGDSTLSFFYPKSSKYYDLIEEEGYIKTKTHEFVIKEKNVEGIYTNFKCSLNLEDLEGKPWERFESVEHTIDKALSLALAGTGWIVGKCTLKKKRTVRITDTSSLGIVQEIKKIYRCDLVFNTLTKTIDVHEHLGEDKGTYFIESLNLKALGIQGNSYNYCTRIIPIGKDDLKISTINNGKGYVENYQYSNKIKTIIWKDDRYTIAQNLKEDAEAKLEELSKPYRSYAATILNLAKLNNDYKDILDYKLGDTITLISKSNKFRDKQRIVKIVEYPKDHTKDTVELANTKLSFEEIQQEFQDAADTVFNITSDNGTVKGKTIDSIESKQIKNFENEVIKAVNIESINAKVKHLEAYTVTITGQIKSVQGTIGTITSNVANIDKLVVSHSAELNEVKVNKADITELNAVNSKINIVEANIGKIETLVNGNLSSINIQAGGITGVSLNMKTIFVTDANIVSVNASKVKAGTIDTNLVNIQSKDGKLAIKDNTIQIKDNSRVRVQVGKDASNDYSMYVWDSAGKLMFDATGLKADGIKNKIIRDNMVADNANIDGKKLNISSVITHINEGTTTIKSSKVQIDGTNQTLDIAFNSLKSQVGSTKSLTEKNSTTISIIQGQIDTAINNTTISKDGKNILLKDDYNRTVTKVDSMKSTIGSYTTQINQATGKLSSIENKVNVVERNLTSITQRVSSTESNTTTLTNKVNQVDGKINDAKYEAINKANEIKDVRSTNESPQWYMQNHPRKLVKEFKSSNTIGVNSGATYGTLETKVPWNDSSGGYPTQTFYSNNKTYERTGTSNTSWCTWKQIEDINGSQNKANKALTDAKAYITTEVTKTNNKVASIETSLSSITSKVKAVETTTTKINSQSAQNKQNISKVETRLKTAESKLTKGALTTTIGNYYTTSSQVNGIVTSKGYATETQVKQIVNGLQVKISENGGYNLLYNGDFRRKSFWVGSIKKWFLNGDSLSNDGKAMGIQNKSANVTAYVQQYIESRNLISAPQYTISAYVNLKSGSGIVTEASEIRIYCRITYEDDSIVYNNIYLDLEKVDKWYRVSKTFTRNMTKNIKQLTFSVGVKNTNYIIFISQAMLNVGDLVPWSPNPNEAYDGIITADKDGITVEASNVNSRTHMGADGLKITKTDINEDVFFVNSKGILNFDGIVTTHNGSRKSGYFGLDSVKFYNWWEDTNEIIAHFFGGKSDDNKRTAEILGKDCFKLGIGEPNGKGGNIIKGTKSKLEIYADTDFENHKINNLNSINENKYTDLWISRLFIRNNQINNNIDSGNLWLNYWRGYNSPNKISDQGVYIGNGNNDGSYGRFVCGDLKAYGKKNCVVETDYGHLEINAYETADYYFGDIGETILDDEGYSYVYIDSIFAQTVNTVRKYQVFLSVYGEGIANVIERHPTYFVIKGTPGIEIGYEIKAKRKGYEDYRLEREVNSFVKGQEHGLDDNYKREKEIFYNSIVNTIEDNMDLDNTQLVEFVDRKSTEYAENKELLNIVEESVLNESIN